MELNLTQEQVAQINAILNSMPISELQRVQAIIKILQDASRIAGQTEVEEDVPETETHELDS